jgi:hypothetical protein
VDAWYGVTKGGWCTGIVRGSHGCGLWKVIMAGWDNFAQQVELQVGDGTRVRLWHDRWCGDAPLKELFSTLFVCSSNREATIDSVLIHQNGGVDWNVSFVQHFNDWEMDVVAAFLNQLYSYIPSNSDNDVMWWRLNKKGCFDICLYYYALKEIPFRAFPWKCVWRSKAPRRVCFFVWSVAWGRILTCDNLIRRGYIMTSWCCMCRCNGESVDYLLRHCKIAGALCHFVIQSFGLSWVFSNCLLDLLSGWWYMQGKHTSDVWNLIPPCLL